MHHKDRGWTGSFSLQECRKRNTLSDRRAKAKSNVYVVKIPYVVVCILWEYRDRRKLEVGTLPYSHFYDFMGFLLYFIVP